MSAEIYTALIYEENFLDANIEHTIEVFAKFIPAYRPLYRDGEPDEDASWDIYHVFMDGVKMDIDTIAAMLYDNERRMTEDVLIGKLIRALNEQGEPE